MLFTRCPNCQTTFRISADTLRVAHGAVRCGNCSIVYSVFSGLRQDALDPGMQADEELLSPTLQTQELAAIEELASPEVELKAAAGDATTESDTARADENADPDLHELPPHDEAPVELTHETPAAEPGAIEPSAVAEDHTHLESDSDEAPLEPATGATLAALHFEVPADDEWTQVLKEIEESAQDEQPAAPSSDDRDAATASANPSSEDERPDFFDIGEPHTPERRAEAESARAHREPAAINATSSESSAAPSAAVALEETVAADSDIDPTTAEELISDEQIDATLSAEPDAELMTALEASLGTTTPAPAKQKRLWRVGAAAMALMLTAQLVHHNRALLATQPGVGSLIQHAYGLLGVTLVPNWDLDQYDISNWAATAGETENGIGNLRITAQIQNSGSTPQPYPSIRLELKDRWETVIGRRVFTPHEYLGADFDADALMSSGESIPAELAVVDPGLDASGFELDVCMAGGNEGYRCAGDRVFE